MADASANPRFARAYVRMSELADERGGAEHRERLLRGLSGRVLEVGAGNGRNFAHYPRTVDEVVAVEPDGILRAHAERAAAVVPVRLVDGDASRLPAADGEFDAVVYSLVLCSVPDVAAALAEAWRALRPGGEVRYYEHVRSGSAIAGRLQDLITPLWSRLGGGCHPNRDTEGSLRAAGFEVTGERFSFRPQPLIPPTAHILGVARKV
ncbi:class I SAM-dependent methyltransferase [Amycolatopsis acidicola]|uniref:Class I SAM-dependent methyltransferase n=1 Tax=Amycolatopsis acidicola TaxID=2596893 RepID=A0A5N0VAN3_9PSEU|nr:class I SAM-dependent methyltransferase [Amycolatopsis acidicola]KAA9162031.1 class I SAM-dependent methyltransferase [Amycolatopsis acidicola]